MPLLGFPPVVRPLNPFPRRCLFRGPLFGLRVSARPGHLISLAKLNNSMPAHRQDALSPAPRCGFGAGFRRRISAAGPACVGARARRRGRAVFGCRHAVGVSASRPARVILIIIKDFSGTGFIFASIISSLFFMFIS